MNKNGMNLIELAQEIVRRAEAKRISLRKHLTWFLEIIP